MVVKNAHMSIQGSGGNPTFPAQWRYGLYVISPVTGFLATVISGTYRKLDASTGASGPHVFAVRFRAVVKGTAASTASHPALMTIAKRPSYRDGTKPIYADLGPPSTEISENQNFFGRARCTPSQQALKERTRERLPLKWAQSRRAGSL